MTDVQQESDPRSDSAPAWARMRQVIIATNSIEADADALRQAAGLGRGFHDTELAEHRMADVTFALADGTYLQLITSLAPEDSVRRWTTKVGGRGGYALSIQQPDPVAVQARAEQRGVGIVRAQEALGYPIVQLHPRDTGLLLEADGIADPDVWFWDDLGPDAAPEPGAAVTGLAAVEVTVADAAAMAALWRELLDLAPGDDPRVLDLGGCELRFVDGPPSPDWTIVLRGTAELDPALLPGVTLRVES